MQPHSVCVYCASSDNAGRRLRDVATELGAGIAERGWRLVYGGGDVGLMGEVARAALAGGVHVTGVIPHRLTGPEHALGSVTELIRVDTMRDRKRIMDERADAFVVLPGGIGTLEELMEVLTTRHLRFHERPLVLLDPDDYWRPFHQLLRHMIAAGLASPRVAESLTTTTTVEQCLDSVAPRPGHAPAAGT